MSTNPTPLPIDAPAPVPSVSPYPEGIASFYYPGYPIVPALPYDATKTPQQQFNPNAPMKAWQRAQQPGENGGTFKLWNCIANGVEVPNGVAQTIAQAAEVNIAPSGMPESVIDSLAGTAYFTQPAVPIPTRPLLPTEDIAPGLPGMWIVTNSADASAPVPETPAQMSDDATLQRVLSGVNALLGKAGLPAV